ncbi:prepilin-type N-terminal cleavage/methylation domain-containing protein [Holophaga foetida]|uniref:prepilin-type N-terminal cleavage/methylation domain-containing protein n=1 Tax=Holophaga foetida TaxID=35839 RepID=UPI0002475065|nr:prepilin-type N-terminal cleavage/methylation domain-containing protein [Holophaga foetida]
MREAFLSKRRSLQAGFSMVEMLMAAFVLAIGLLGLATLQLMSLKASRGGKSLSTAVQVAERVMDQIEMEGRLSWLNVTDSAYAAPTALSNLNYIGKNFVAEGDFSGKLYLTFDDQGKAVADAPVSGDKPSGRYVATVEASAPTNGGTGRVSDFTVIIEFADQADQNSVAIVRTVTLTRRILHG